jgi:hypothetical protein
MDQVGIEFTTQTEAIVERIRQAHEDDPGVCESVRVRAKAHALSSILLLCVCRRVLVCGTCLFCVWMWVCVPTSCSHVCARSPRRP